MGEALGEPESGKQQQGAEGKAQINVVENVVSHLMAEDEQGLRQSEVAGGGVPYHDALGCAEAGDVGVVGGQFVAGVHQEDARFGNLQSRGMGQALELRRQLGIGLRQAVRSG